MESFREMINSTIPVMVDFSAEWCQPCRMMPPILKEIKNHFGDRIRILKVDVDKNVAVAQRYNIRSVPTLILFRNGRVLFRRLQMEPNEYSILVESGIILDRAYDAGILLQSQRFANP